MLSTLNKTNMSANNISANTIENPENPPATFFQIFEQSICAHDGGIGDQSRSQYCYSGGRIEWTRHSDNRVCFDYKDCNYSVSDLSTHCCNFYNFVSFQTRSKKKH